MCNILIVENEPELCEQLVRLFVEELPDANIDSALSVEEGLRLIQNAANSQHPYDVAILDFRLPPRTGEHERVDDTVCQAIRDTYPVALVVHITGFPDDPDIQRHMAQYHIEIEDTRAVLISKLERNWPEDMLRKVKSFHYGGGILVQISALFRPAAEAISPLNRASLNRSGTLGRDTTLHGGQSATHTLAALMRDIIAHWDDLDESIKDRIRTRFEVDENRSPVGLSLR